jgi:hypothetical protein
LKKTHYKKRADGVAQGEGPEFKLQCCKNSNKKLFVFTMNESEEYINIQYNKISSFFETQKSYLLQTTYLLTYLLNYYFLQMCLSSFGGSCNEWYEDCSVLECQC